MTAEQTVKYYVDAILALKRKNGKFLVEKEENNPKNRDHYDFNLTM